ncbi:MAG: hypothetical protein L3J91_00695, partial [Thermoplasmata archaeon]|nr:hypothetical protein [Thermoplasmata archaeon]
DAGTAPTADERWEETEQILREIDGLCDDIRPKGGAPVAPPALAPAAESAGSSRLAPPRAPTSPAPPPAVPGAHGPTAAPADLWESPNSFLEERLRLADEAAGDLGHDIRLIAETWPRVAARIGALEVNVRNAHEEMVYIRAAARGWASAPPELPASPTPYIAPARPALPAKARSAPARSPAAPAPSGPYVAYTADRYNRTIGALKARRRRLAGWTFLTAGLLSLALVTVTALAKEAMPPMWLAVLPAVWMIPVPFFVLSFRGTQRVLRHNHLEVPGGPP